MSTQAPRLTFIIGCTGSGKGRLGRELARRSGGEIISIDSMKVYRRMDIGTAKPSLQVRREIPHHLIDVVEPSEAFSVAKYVDAADRAIQEIHMRDRPIFIVGGTPLYIKGLLQGLFEGPGANPEIRARLRETADHEGPESLHRQLQKVDPDAASRIHPNDLRRIIRALEVFELTGRTISRLQVQWNGRSSRYEHRLIGIRRERADQNCRTNERVRRMVDAGLADEVRSLLAEPEPLWRTARQALGYAEMIQFLEGTLSLAEAIEMIKINTRQFAKAQRTWFKRFRRTHWIDVEPCAEAAELADGLEPHWDALWST